MQESSSISFDESNIYTSFQEGLEVRERSLLDKAYGNFIARIFDEWARRDMRKVFVQPFDVSLATWLDLPVGPCTIGETCGNALVLEHNGNVCMCHRYIEWDYLSSNEESPPAAMVASERQRALEHTEEALPHYCLECKVRFACNGGCSEHRILSTPDGGPGLGYLCQGYRTFFYNVDKSVGVMAQTLRQGQPASTATSYQQHKDGAGWTLVIRAGRNESDLFRRGKKAERCCRQAQA